MLSSLASVLALSMMSMCMCVCCMLRMEQARGFLLHVSR